MLTERACYLASYALYCTQSIGIDVLVLLYIAHLYIKEQVDFKSVTYFISEKALFPVL